MKKNYLILQTQGDYEIIRRPSGKLGILKNGKAHIHSIYKSLEIYLGKYAIGVDYNGWYYLISLNDKKVILKSISKMDYRHGYFFIVEPFKKVFGD